MSCFYLNNIYQFFYITISSSSSHSLTIEALTIISQSCFNLVNITHCVTLEVFLIHLRFILIVCPHLDIRIISETFLSSSDNIFAETSLPVFSVTFIAFTPDPHLF
ncbi:MAG: hypothetical protein Q8S84_00035 [bacterium]|nr:hypothetical protein [bacterium]MDP3379989.1 hypothetical protein [bacterium]